MITIATATTNDINAILKIVEDARTLITKQGFKQWTKESNYPNYDTFMADINNNSLYVAKENDEVVGFMALCFGEDPSYAKIEGKWLNKEASYSTIHRLAIKANYYNKGIAKALINYAFTLSKKHCQYIRIDTHKNNLIMNSLAQKMGFHYCGKIYILDDKIDPERNAYERMI